MDSVHLGGRRAAAVRRAWHASAHCIPTPNAHRAAARRSVMRSMIIRSVGIHSGVCSVIDGLVQTGQRCAGACGAERAPRRRVCCVSIPGATLADRCVLQAWVALLGEGWRPRGHATRVMAMTVIMVSFRRCCGSGPCRRPT